MNSRSCYLVGIVLLLTLSGIETVNATVIMETQVAVYDKDRSVPLWTYSSHDMGSASISKDGSYVITAGSKLSLFDRSNGALIWEYTPNNGSINQVVTSSDGEYIVAEGASVIHLFSRYSNAPLWSYTTDLSIKSIAISSDGRRIVLSTSPTVVGTKGKTYLFSRDSAQPLWTYSGGEGAWSVSISSDGKFIADASFYYLHLFSENSNVPLWTYTAGGWVVSVTISADGNYIVATVETWSGGEWVYLFARESNTPLWGYQTKNSNIRSVAVSSDGEYIVVPAGDNLVALFSKASNIPLWEYDTGRWIDSVAISDDGNYIAAAGKGIYLFNSPTSQPSWALRYDQGYLYTVSMSSDGEYFVTYGPSNSGAYGHPLAIIFGLIIGAIIVINIARGLRF